MDEPGAPARRTSGSRPQGAAPEAAPRDPEILPWEHIGDDLWLPRRVRGSFHGGALG